MQDAPAPPRTSGRERAPTRRFGEEQPVSAEEEARRAEKSRKLKERKARPPAPRSKWAAYEAKVDSLISKARAASFFLDTYGRDFGEARGGRGLKIRPEGEIALARRKIRSVKAEIRATLCEVAALHSETRWGVEGRDEGLEDDLDVEHVACSACGGLESTEHNDILLCDRKGCFRAFHTQCCTPAMAAEDVGGPEEDWFCQQCAVLDRCVLRVNDEFEKTYTPDEWAQVLDPDDDDDDDDDAHQSQAEPAAGSILAFDADAYDEEEDSDFDSVAAAEESDSARGAADGSGESDGDDDDDDDGDDDDDDGDASGDDLAALDAPADADGRPVLEDVTDSNIIEGPRKRTRVDYQALNAAMFGGEPESDDEGWGK